MPDIKGFTGYKSEKIVCNCQTQDSSRSMFAPGPIIPINRVKIKPAAQHVPKDTEIQNSVNARKKKSTQIPKITFLFFQTQLANTIY
jgi:hypothetical protein